MDDMKRMRRQLVKLKPIDSLEQHRINQASYALHCADSLMWKWMYQYRDVRDVRDSLDHEQLMNYLLLQKQKILLVNRSMKSAMKESEKILEKSSNE